MASKPWEEFVSQLSAAGYFRFTSAEVLDEVKRGIIETESLFVADGYGELVGRVFAGDAERLAEGGVLAFLFQVSPFLQRQGVGMLVYLDQDIDPERFHYKVMVNLDEYTMLDENERGEVIAWVAVPARAFGLVNKLLERVGSPERVYTTFGSIAQSSLAIFLTEELYGLIKNSPLVSEEESLLTVEELVRLI